jgi:eukaryotic-like serine/threonine-protein kinase
MKQFQLKPIQFSFNRPPWARTEATPQAPLKEYLLSKELWYAVAALAGLVIVVLIIGFYLILPLVTRHNSGRKVPNVSSQFTEKRFIKLDQAAELLSKAGFEAEVADSQYHPDLPPLAVISQDPVPDAWVKAGRTVNLVVNKQAPPMVKCPDVIESNVDQAKRVLENWNLRVGNIAYVAGNFPNLVMGLKYKGKQLERFEEVPQGAKIDLLVSAGAGTARVRLPEVVGLFIDDAISELNRAGLVANVQYNGRDTKDDGKVVQQSPKYQQQDSVSYGSTVILIVAGKNPNQSFEGDSDAEPAEQTDNEKESDKKSKSDKEKDDPKASQPDKPKNEKPKSDKPKKDND